MPRKMNQEYPEAFRIVVTKNGFTSYYGPYATKAAAKGQISSLRRDAHSRYWSTVPVAFEAHIEKSVAQWERVEA